MAEEGKKLSFSEITTLQDKVGNIVNSPIEVRNAANNLNKLREISPENRAAQVGIVYSFIKTLDPAGVVRESEQGMLANAGGPAEAFAALINRTAGQGPLTPGMINEIVQTGEALANQSIEGAEEALVDYLGAYGDTLDSDTKNRMYNRLPSPFVEPVTPEESAPGTLPPPPPGTQIASGPDGKRYYIIDGRPVPAENFQSVPQPGQIPTQPQLAQHTITDQ